MNNLISCVFLVLLSISSNALPSTLELDAHTKGGLAIKLFYQGTELTLLLDTSLAKHVILNATAAQKLDLEASAFGRAVIEVRGQEIEGLNRKARVQILGKSVKRRMIWFDHEVVENYDGVIGLGSLPVQRIRINLKPKKISNTRVIQRTYNLQRKKNRYFAKIDADDHRFLVAFKPQSNASLLSEPAFRRLRQAGHLTELAEYKYQKVFFGLFSATQKISNVESKHPLAFFDLRTDFYRTIDNMPLHEVIDDTKVEEILHEVVVYGRRPTRQRRKEINSIVLGMYALERCYSIDFDMKQKNVVLNCA